MPYSIGMNTSVFSSAAGELIHHLPLVRFQLSSIPCTGAYKTWQIFVATNTLLYSRSAALSSILVIEQTSFTMRNTVDSLFSGVTRLNRDLSAIKTFYAGLDAYFTQHALSLFLQSYPLPEHKDDVGMGIELR